MADKSFEVEFSKALGFAKSQARIGEICNVSQQSVSLYRANRKMPVKRAELLVKQFPDLDFKILIGVDSDDL